MKLTGFFDCMAKTNGQRILILLNFLKLLAHVIPSCLPATLKALKDPKGSKSAKIRLA
jgi:hypothetical protein